MTLKQGEINKAYKVQTMQLPDNLNRRLQVLGMLPGTQVMVLNNKKNGAMTIKMRGTRFAIGKVIAENIQVEEQSI